MAKNSIRDYSATNSSNTDIQSIDISEGCSPAGINNAIREVMADLKDVSTGAVALESPAFDSVTGNLNVNGTVTADGLTVDGDLAVSAANSRMRLYETDTTDLNTQLQNQAGDFNIQTLNDSASLATNRISIDHATGDISFYEDTGTSAKFFWDASAEALGIGTSSPATLLDVKDASPTNNAINEVARFTAAFGAATTDHSLIKVTATPSSTNSATRAAGIYATNAANADIHLLFGTGNNNERMRLTSAGYLLVGTDTTYGYGGLSILPNIDDGACRVGFDRSATTAPSVVVLFRNGGTQVGSISYNSSSTSYGTSSDYRLKTAVNYDWDATTRLKQLRPARFEWIADGDDAVPVDGFLAHEVQDVVPEAISGTKDAMMDEEYQVSAATGDIYTPAIEAVLDEDGNEVTPAVAEVIHSTDVERPEELAEGQQWRETTPAVMGTRSVPDYQGIDQSKLVPLLVKTIQELEARITALEAN